MSVLPPTSGCHQCGCLGLQNPHAPFPLLLPAGGEWEARHAGQGWCAREGRRGRSSWEDGTLLFTLCHPKGTPTQLSLGCLQLRLRAVSLVPGLTRTFRASWSQGKARGCWSSRAGECRAALSSAPGQDEGCHPYAALHTCPLCPLPQAITGPPGAKGEKVRSQGVRGGVGKGLLDTGIHSAHI